MTLVRPLFSEARFYTLGYLLAAAVLLAATTPPLSFAASTVIFGALLGLGIAWVDALKTAGRELTPIDRDDVLFEQPLARLRRRLLLGHQSRSGRLTIAVPLVTVTAFGVATGVDRADAVGGMAAGLLVYLGMHNLGLMGTFARIEHDAGGELVSTVAPTRPPMPLLVLPRE